MAPDLNSENLHFCYLYDSWLFSDCLNFHLYFWIVSDYVNQKYDLDRVYTKAWDIRTQWDIKSEINTNVINKSENKQMLKDYKINNLMAFQFPYVGYVLIQFGDVLVWMVRK